MGRFRGLETDIAQGSAMLVAESNIKHVLSNSPATELPHT